METMKALAWSALVVCVSLGTALSAAAQTPVGALAIDERQGDQYGWAVDYETASAAQERALQECGSGCSVVLTFGRCAAYAADQDADSTAVGWAESFDSAAGARQAALSECGSRGGSGCTVRVWGCNGPVVEERLDLNQAARRQVQLGLRSAGFDPGGADGLFGPRTRAAIRSWQAARRTVDRVSGRSASRGVTRQKRIPAAGRGGCCGHRCWRGGSRLLAVDREQHDPGGLRSVSGAVSERGVQRASAESARGVARYGGFPIAGCRVECGWRRCALGDGWSVPPSANVRRATGRVSMLAGDFPAAWMSRLESEPSAGLGRDLDW